MEAHIRFCDVSVNYGKKAALQGVALEIHDIEYTGDPIDRLYFLEEGMASMTTTFKDGSQVEVGMFGYESVIGVSALMGTRKSLNRVYTQIAGHGYCCHVEDARREFRLGGYFQLLALRYVQAQLVQAMQTAGCNAKHNFEQRLARWLLICADRAHIDTFKISHEFLADMLGGRRPTISTDSRDSQAKRTYRIHPRRNSHPRCPWAHEDLLRVLSDYQTSPRQLRRVRHRNPCVAASTRRSRGCGPGLRQSREWIGFDGSVFLGIDPWCRAVDNDQCRISRSTALLVEQILHLVQQPRRRGLVVHAQ